MRWNRSPAADLLGAAVRRGRGPLRHPVGDQLRRAGGGMSIRWMRVILAIRANADHPSEPAPNYRSDPDPVI